MSQVGSDMKNLSATDQHRPQKNSLIRALPPVDCERLARNLELIPLTLGQVLYESGETMSHAYFPIDCIVSILYVMKNGESAEIAIVGNEGMIGVTTFMGGESTMSRAIVQNAGHAYRVKAQILKGEFHSGGALSRLLLLFSSALITQIVQTAACNRHHPVDKQLCRWMLLSLDRLASSRIHMTEKLIGNMLGLSPGDVTTATNVLQKAGLIHYNAGEITVLDRAGVEKRSCECYEVVKKESDRLLPLSSRIGQ
jgi:CRP-like cAMP-binding protein